MSTKPKPQDIRKKDRNSQSKPDNYRRIEENFKEDSFHYRSIFENMLEGLAYCRIILDKYDRPIDFIYLYVNDAFKRLTGLIDVVGKRAYEAIPGFMESHPQLVEIYGRVALTGLPEKFEIQLEPLGAYLSISVFSDKYEYFAFVFENITERILAEVALRENEERYRSLFEASIDAILLTAPDGRILDANPSTCRMFGRTVEEIKKVGRNGLTDTSDTRLMLAIEERNLTGRFSGELPCIRKDGTKFPGELFSAVFKDKDGNSRTSMIIRDMTERIQVEEALRLREETLREAQRVGKLSSWRYDLRELCDDWKGKEFMLFGQEKQPIYSTFADISLSVHPDDRLTLNAAMEQAIFGKVNFDLYLRSTGPTGEIGYIHMVCDVIKDEKGRATELIGTTQNITEIKTIQCELEVSETRYRTVVEDQTEIISRLSADGKFLYANQAYCRFFNKNLDELTGEGWQPMVHEEDVAKIDRKLSELSPRNPVVIIENRVYSGEGSIHWMQFVNRGIFDSSNKFIEIQSVGRDISELKNSQLELQKRDEELTRNNTKLEKLNIALEVVIEQKNEQLENLRSDIIKQFTAFVKPHIDGLKDISLNRQEQQYLKLIEQRMEQILSPFARQVMSFNQNLSPMEIKVASLTTSGMTTKKMAQELGVSHHTVKYHRKNIRSKLGIKNQKTNLRSYLMGKVGGLKG